MIYRNKRVVILSEEDASAQMTMTTDVEIVLRGF